MGDSPEDSPEDEFPAITNLELGKRYHRVALHEKYGGARYRGIAPSGDYPYVFIFTGDAGEAHGYKDEFRGDTFIYTGEGREGGMEWSMDNKAIRDHQQEGRELHLFESTDDAWIVTYLGQYECVDWFNEPLPDTNGNMRVAIRFKLDPVNDEIDVGTADLDEISVDDLYRRAKETTAAGHGEQNETTTETTRTVYPRSEVVKAYARRVADGVCQGCGDEAPFIDKGGNPYLEVHHLYRRSDGGPDDPDNVIALCPNCHRRVHHGRDGETFNRDLIDKVENRIHSVRADDQ